MGLLTWDLGRITESKRYFEEARAAFELCSDIRSAEFSADCLEIIRLYEQGKKDRDAKYLYLSLRRFEEAISLGQAIGIPDFALKCLRQQGLTYWEMDELVRFHEVNERALGIATVIGHQVEKGRCLNNLGISYHRRNEYSLAAEYLESALTCIRSAGDRPTEAECLSNLGVLYRDLGNYSRARSCLAGALALDREIGDRESMATDMGNLGTLLLRKGADTRNKDDLFQSLEAFRECASLRDALSSDARASFATLNDIGIVYNELGEHGMSRSFFEAALRAVNGTPFAREKGHVLCNIAASYLYERRVDEARRYYEISYRLGAENALENVLIESSFGLGKCHELSRADTLALDYYQRSVIALERIRERLSSEILSIGFARNKLGAYQSIIDILARQYLDRPADGLLEQLFSTSERAKARAFLESILAAAPGPSPDSPRTQERLESLSENIAELAERLARPGLPAEEKASVNDELEHEEGEFVRLSSELDPRARQGRPLATDSIYSFQDLRRQILDDQSILLEYDLGDERSYLVAVTAMSAGLFLLPGRTALEKSLRAYLKMTSEGSFESGAGHGAAERIGRELLPFVGRAEYGGKTKLIIIPDGALHYLPFEALRIPAESGSQYLVEKFSVSYSPSASSLNVLKNTGKTTSWKMDLLAVGGPLYEEGDARSGQPALSRTAATRRLYGDEPALFCPLPYSRQEAREVAGMFPRKRVVILEREAASEGALKALPLGDFRIIHFACHGLIDEEHPFRSALALSFLDEPDNDGFLQTREIYGLKTRADLVVLSACRTAGSFLEPSEGAMGLARAFFFSGTRSVLASLWPVNDRAAVDLMKEFYRRILSGNDAAEALRLAKLKLLRTSRNHPFYWGGFVLIGDSEAVALR
ncbi:MAG TPA: CHAT domain-containing tetratricopeptide repeat protein [Acidobacteriota bacterium]|nr:CHAT domain-containing tetratricopeptide repeat protein [Acidobacteriota bacterium]